MFCYCEKQTIIPSGYNGSIHEHPHCKDNGRLFGDNAHCIHCIYSELNSILPCRAVLIKR